MQCEPQDDTFASLVDTDVAVGSIEERKLSFDEKLALLEEAVTKHPLNREVLYKMLAFCSVERSVSEIEVEVASYPEFKSATQNPHHMAQTLERAYGLSLIERDAQKMVVLPEQKEGLTEDEIDDLVCSQFFRVTDVGAHFVSLHHPKARLVELLDLAPQRAATYIDLLEFVSEKPRTYFAIQALLQGKPALETVIDGERTIMQPSVFVDKLERAGALVWSGEWSLTEEGEAFLKDLKETETK